MNDSSQNETPRVDSVAPSELAQGPAGRIGPPRSGAPFEALDGDAHGSDAHGREVLAGATSLRRTLHGLPMVPPGSRPHADPTSACFLGAPPEGPKLNEALSTIKNWFRARSLWVLAYGTGCGAIELRPLSTARFDMERFGIAMRPTPRQSNVLIVSGYLSLKTLKRVIRSYEQMPSPKWVVGLGSCTINGGMYWDSYYTVKQLDLYLPVDIYIAGCMPRPEALLAGFGELMKRIEKGQANGWADYLERLEWYRENQKRLISNWNMPEYNW